MDQYVEALKRLCETHGGYNKVADAAGVNGQTLYQITAGVTLPSGNPRGVGPTLRKKLSAAFPLWLRENPAAEMGDVFDVMTAEESDLLYNFRSLTDQDRERYSREIATRANELRTHLEKHLDKMKGKTPAERKS
jgi:hypothetical protein